MRKKQEVLVKNDEMDAFRYVTYCFINSIDICIISVENEFEIWSHKVKTTIIETERFKHYIFII